MVRVISTQFDLTNKLKFSTPEAVRLFTEGLHSLEAFNKSGNNTVLKAAVEQLRDCTSEYPSDVFPRLYLGVACALQGYDGQDEALSHFRWVESSGIEALRRTAQYNQAASHIEKYHGDDMDQAARILDKLIRLGDSPDNIKPPELFFLSRIVRVFISIHLLSESLSFDETLDLGRLGQSANELLEREQAIKEKYDTAPIPGASDAVLVNHYNNIGSIYLCCGLIANERRDLEKTRESGKKAHDAYSEALKLDPNWAPARSNYATVWLDLLGQPDRAATIWQELAEGEQQKLWAHFNLSILYAMQNDLPRALSHFHDSKRFGDIKKLVHRMKRHSASEGLVRELLELFIAKPRNSTPEDEIEKARQLLAGITNEPRG